MDAHGGEFRSEIALVDPTHAAPHDDGDEAHLSGATADRILHDANGSHADGNHHHHHLLIALEDEVVYGHPQGARMGRTYKKSNWSAEEMLVLQAAKREDRDRGAAGGQTPAHERWNWIEDYCWTLGTQRSAQQCHDKWEVVSAAYKKVYNNEAHVCHGQQSYWNMSPDERRKNKLPPNFQREVFDALLEWCNTRLKNADSGELVVDTSGPPGPSGVKSESADSDDESGEETSEPNPSGKKRKRWPRAEDGLATILARNNKSVVDAMLESEDRKDKRHREYLAMERVKLELEKEKFRGAMTLGGGYIDALVNIGDGLKQLGAALCSNIHS